MDSRATGTSFPAPRARRAPCVPGIAVALLTLALLLAPARCPAGFLLRARPASGGFERYARLPADGGWAYEARALDFGFGPRLTDRWAATVDVFLINGFPTRNNYAGPDLDPSIGAGIVHAGSLRSHPHDLVTSLRADGTWLDTPKFIRLTLGTCMTWWAVSPELELTWRREWADPLGSGNLVRYDWFALAVRLGIGGWYEF